MFPLHPNPTSPCIPCCSPSPSHTTIFIPPPRMNAELLQSRPDILATVLDHLFGQLEGYVCTLTTKYKVQESQLGDFLCYVNTLLATHEVLRAALATELWFGTLLKIVDVNTTSGEEES